MRSAMISLVSVVMLTVAVMAAAPPAAAQNLPDCGGTVAAACEHTHCEGTECTTFLCAAYTDTNGDHIGTACYHSDIA